MHRLRRVSTKSSLRRAATLAIVLAVVFASAGRSAAAAQRRSAYAITGATVITSPGNAVDNATVVLRDGLIEAVGAGVAAPPDARLIDGSGMTVYAGWIDSFSEVAIQEAPSAAPTPAAGERGGFGRGGRGGGRQALQMLELGSPGANQHVHPEFIQADNLTNEDDGLAGFRDAGFTAALVATLISWQNWKPAISADSKRLREAKLSSECSLMWSVNSRRESALTALRATCSASLLASPVLEPGDEPLARTPISLMPGRRFCYRHSTPFPKLLRMHGLERYPQHHGVNSDS